MLSTITRIRSEFGDDVFKNIQRTNALLMDLAPGQVRERLLVRSFLEADGFDIMRGGEDYSASATRIIQQLTDVFSLKNDAAAWVVRLFGEVLGQVEGAGTAMLALPYLQGQAAIGKTHVAAVMADGTVIADGTDESYQCNVGAWRDVVAVAAGDAHTLGLRADGTVYAAGSNAYDQCDVLDLKDVTGIYAFGHDSVFVFADGRARAVGRSKWDLTFFEEIASIAPYPEGIIGIRTDGTLMLAAYAAEDEILEEREWLLAQTDVAQVVSTYTSGSIVLTRDGRLLKSGEAENYFAQWRDVKAIASVTDGFAVLCADGTVRILSFDRTKPRISTYADRWENIRAIYGGYRRLMGLTSDAQLVAACTNAGWLWQNAAMSIDYVTTWYPVGVHHG